MAKFLCFQCDQELEVADGSAELVTCTKCGSVNHPPADETAAGAAERRPVTGTVAPPAAPGGVGAPAAEVRTSGFAIVSLICGIVGFVPLCPFLPGILGLIFGIVSLGGIKKSGGRLTGRGLAIAGTVVSGLATLMWLLAVPMVVGACKQGMCAFNLGAINKAIWMYQNDFDDAMPPNLEALIDTENLEPRRLVCPSSGDQEGQCSYIYRGADLSATAPADMIIAYDKQAYHDDKRRGVLFAGSNVRVMLEQDFQQAIDKDNKRRRELGLAEKPLGE